MGIRRAEDVAIDVQIDASSTAYLENPTFVVHGWTSPSTVKLDGVTLAADRGYFASIRGGASELWLTIDTEVRGAGHRLTVR